MRAAGRVARGHLLRLLGRPLAAALERAARRSDRRAGVALVYHEVSEPPGDLRRELLPALGTDLFARQLRYLRACYRLVTASELLRATREREPGDPFPVAITFDDDLRSHVDVVAPLLESADAPATFFLTGASLDGPYHFWWEHLQAAVDRGHRVADALGAQSPNSSIHDVGHAIERLPSGERERIHAMLAELVDPDLPDSGLRSQHVEQLAAHGFEIGFHTRRHDRLPDLGEEALRRALREGRDKLEGVLGCRLAAIAYPHGAADPRVARAARGAGFDVGFTGSPQAAVPASDPLLLGRLSPSYESLGELAFDIAWALFRAIER